MQMNSLPSMYSQIMGGSCFVINMYTSSQAGALLGSVMSGNALLPSDQSIAWRHMSITKGPCDSRRSCFSCPQLAAFTRSVCRPLACCIRVAPDRSRIYRLQFDCDPISHCRVEISRLKARMAWNGQTLLRCCAQGEEGGVQHSCQHC